MNRFFKVIIFIFTPSVFCTFGGQLSAQTAHKMSREGDAAYVKKDYKLAEENYTKSLTSQASQKAKYNLGNSIYMQQRYDDAIKQYDEVAAKTNDNQLKTNALYNKGNAYFWKKDYKNAIEAYKDAARLNPRDEDIKMNLAKAKKMQEIQKQEEEKQKKNQNKGDKKDDKNKEQDPKNQDKNDPKNQQKPEENKDPQQNPNQDPKQKAQQDLKKEDAKRMLQIMDDEERKVQQRLKKGNANPARSGKDW